MGRVSVSVHRGQSLSQQRCQSCRQVEGPGLLTWSQVVILMVLLRCDMKKTVTNQGPPEEEANGTTTTLWMWEGRGKIAEGWEESMIFRGRAGARLDVVCICLRNISVFQTLKSLCYSELCEESQRSPTKIIEKKLSLRNVSVPFTK